MDPSVPDPQLERLRRKSAIREVWGYVRAKRVYWMIPLLALLLVVGVLVVLGQSPAGFFLYALF